MRTSASQFAYAGVSSAETAPPAPGRVVGLTVRFHRCGGTRQRPRALSRGCPERRRTSRSNSLTPTLRARRRRSGRPPRSRRPRPQRSRSRRRRPRRPQSRRRLRLGRPCRRRLRAALRQRSCTGRATSRASRRSRRLPPTWPSDRRSNGRLCALTHTRPSRRSPLSLRLTPAGQAVAGFASGRKPNWPRIRRRRPRSPHFLPASRRNRARARSPRRAPRRQRATPRRRRK